MKTLKRLLSGILATMILISTAQLSSSQTFAMLTGDDLQGVGVENKYQISGGTTSSATRTATLTGSAVRNTITYNTGKYEKSDEFKEALPAPITNIVRGSTVNIADWTDGSKRAWTKNENAYYEFIGWANEESGALKYKPGQTSVTVTENMTLYAVWELRYAVEYKKNCDDASIKVPIDDKLYKANEEVTVKDDLKDQATSKFQGWMLGHKTLKKGDKFTISSNTTLTAQWTNVHTLKYDANSSGLTTTAPEVPKAEEHLDNTTVKVKGLPDGSGIKDYQFVGWNTKSDGSGTEFKVGSDLTIKENMTLYAIWKKIDKYVVTYEKNCTDASVIAPVDDDQYEKGVDVQVLAIKGTREGYTFEGWSTNKDATEADAKYEVGKSFAINGNVTLYAIWKKIDKYVVTYEKNCEDASVTAPVDNTSYESGTKFPVKGITGTREGYTFEGWSTNKDATEADAKYEVGTKATITGDVTLYAVWKAEKYVVTYDANVKDLEDVKEPTVPKDNKEYTIGKEVKVLGAIEVEGYIFKGWSTTVNDKGIVYQPGDTFVIKKNTTLHAIWTKKEADKYVVTYEKNCEDASVTAPVDNTSYESGTKFPVKGITGTREGYTFEGWSTNKDATEADAKYEVGIEATITGDVTLYAVWKEKEVEIVEFMVTYEKNCTDANVTAPVDSKKYEEGDYAEVLPIVGERDGYIFKGYYEETNPLKLFQPGEKIKMEKSVVLVAKWEKAVYYLSLRYYNNSSSDDGQVLLKEEKYEKGEKAFVYGASALGASNGGRNFNGWNTKNDGSGKAYQPGNTIDMTGNIDLFAMWEEDDYNPDEPEPPEPSEEPEEEPKEETQIPTSEPFVSSEDNGKDSNNKPEEVKKPEEDQGPSMDNEDTISLDSELEGDEEPEEINTKIGHRYVIKHLYYTIVDGKLTVAETVLNPEDGVSEVENDISEAIVRTLDKDGYTYVSDDSLDMVYDEENDVYIINLKYYDSVAMDYIGSLRGQNNVNAAEENKGWADDLVDTGLLIGSIAAVLILLGGMVIVKFGFVKKR